MVTYVRSHGQYIGKAEEEPAGVGKPKDILDGDISEKDPEQGPGRHLVF